MSDRPAGIPAKQVNSFEVFDADGKGWEIFGVDSAGRVAVERVVDRGRRRACAIYSDGVLVEVAEGDTFSIEYFSGSTKIVTTLVATRDGGWNFRVSYKD